MSSEVVALGTVQNRNTKKTKPERESHRRDVYTVRAMYIRGALLPNNVGVDGDATTSAHWPPRVVSTDEP